jgi:hypothetical protein
MHPVISAIESGSVLLRNASALRSEAAPGKIVIVAANAISLANAVMALQQDKPGKTKPSAIPDGVENFLAISNIIVNVSEVTFPDKNLDKLVKTTTAVRIASKAYNFIKKI